MVFYLFSISLNRSDLAKLYFLKYKIPNESLSISLLPSPLQPKQILHPKAKLE